MLGACLNLINKGDESRAQKFWHSAEKSEQLFKEAECINSDSLNPCTKILAATHIHLPLTMGFFLLIIAAFVCYMFSFIPAFYILYNVWLCMYGFLSVCLALRSGFLLLLWQNQLLLRDK